MWVRFGVAYDLSTGATAAKADVELQVSYNACGKIAGAVNGIRRQIRLKQIKRQRKKPAE